MTRNGSGTYSLPEAAFVYDTVIDEVAVNSNFSDIASEITNSVAVDGQSTMTGALKMGSQKITGLAAGTTNGDAVRYEQVALLGSAPTFTVDMVIQDSDAGAAYGPNLTLYRDSASPAINDRLGALSFQGKNDADQAVAYVRMMGVIIDETDTTEDGELLIQTYQNGTLTDAWRFGLGLYPEGGSPPGAGNINANLVEVATKVRHEDDDDTYMEFAGDIIKLVTGGGERLELTNSGMQIGNSGVFVAGIETTITDSDTALPTSGAVVDYVATNALPGNNVTSLKGYIWGLTLSNNGTDADHDIDIATGQATNNGNGTLMVLGSALTKRIDAAWAVGTNQGGLDTGTVTADTWYHVWLIMRSDTGVVDAMFSTNATTTPNIPANYDNARRIGAVLTDASSNIIAFTQYGNMFYWDTPADDYAADPGTTVATHVLSVPTGISVKAFLNMYNGMAAYYAQQHPQYSKPTSGVDLTPQTSAPRAFSGAFQDNADNGLSQYSMNIVLWTDTSGQINTRHGVRTDFFLILTIGWEDPRGEFA